LAGTNGITIYFLPALSFNAEKVKFAEVLIQQA